MGLILLLVVLLITILSLNSGETVAVPINLISSQLRGIAGALSSRRLQVALPRGKHTAAPLHSCQLLGLRTQDPETYLSVPGAWVARAF